MAANLRPQSSGGIHRCRFLSGLTFIRALAHSRRHGRLPFFNRQANRPGVLTQNAPVDVGSWQTAQALAPLAVTAEEAQYARDAERLADHEAHQAFASALCKAASAYWGCAHSLPQVEHFQQIVREDQAAVQKLTHFPVEGLACGALRRGRSRLPVMTPGTKTCRTLVWIFGRRSAREAVALLLVRRSRKYRTHICGLR